MKRADKINKENSNPPETQEGLDLPGIPILLETYNPDIRSANLEEMPIPAENFINVIDMLAEMIMKYYDKENYELKLMYLNTRLPSPPKIYYPPQETETTDMETIRKLLMNEGVMPIDIQEWMVKPQRLMDNHTLVRISIGDIINKTYTVLYALFERKTPKPTNNYP